MAGTPLGEELLAPAVPRPAPRSRPEVQPKPALFSSRSVLYAARSADGKRIATVERGEGERGGNELWLYPAGATQELPRLLLSSPVRLAAPAFSRDGSLLAFVDNRDDVKGDIWLLELSKTGSEARRLTGKEAAEDAPVFTVDGSALVYQRQLPGSAQRELMRLALKGGSSAPLLAGIDAAFAAPSPDGRSWVFVSRKADPGGDLWLWQEGSAKPRQLTSGPERDLYPAWEGAETILFSRFAAPAGNSATGATPGQIFRLHLERRAAGGLPAAFPLTAGAFPALAPLPVGEHFLFVAGQGGGGQLLSLPASGEIPDQADVAAQWELARLIIGRQPPSPAYARLACLRVLAREEAPTRPGALAALALAGLMEQEGETARAEETYAGVARNYAAFHQEAALAEIARLRLETARRCSDVLAAGKRKKLISAADEAMKRASQGKGADAAARALIDSARLLAEFGAGATDQLTAIGLFQQAATLQEADRGLRAEAALRRARLLVKLESGEGAQSALAAVARDYDDQEQWAEAAIAAILDQVLSSAKEGHQELAGLAERYRTSLPRLAMGAWNRSGDLAYRDNDWKRAKDAYRTVLEQFPALRAPTAAARFALAEVLYREERYAEATALYEKEMGEQPEDSPLYQLARLAYINKTIAAGENLFRLGEVAAARSLFLDLIRYEGRSVEAHRGYIKSVAAQGQAAELLDLYHRLLKNYPDDAVLLYATGLCASYLPGREPLEEAQRLVARAGERMPESEYPPQTLGYLAEVEETVHGQKGGLERALELYRRAWLLNRSQEHPQNRANLDLNIANAAFLLGRNATAWNHYSRRLAAGVPFDNPDTELIFQQRYAAVAFQMGEKEAPIAGYSRALKLAQGRQDPSRPLELFGRLSRRVMERYFDEQQRGSAAEQTLAEQQAIADELDRLGAIPPEAPPSAGWQRFEQSLAKLLEREQRLLASAASWNREAAAKHGVELQGMLAAVEKELDAVPRLVETCAQIHDRLGLALLEAERFAQAREHFESAFVLNRGVGHFSNLSQNRRSAGVAAYRQAQTASGEVRLRLLAAGRDYFREALSLMKQYPPLAKGAPKRGEGLLNIGVELAFDKGGATEAAFGFSAVQEQRLAETYLARIASELGDPAGAAVLLAGLLQRYPADKTTIAERDLYGVGLLAHRKAHVDYALGDRRAAAAGFRRSTLLALKAGNPVSAMLNLVNWGELLAVEDKATTDEFLSTTASLSQLAGSYRATLPGLAFGRFHNDLGTILARLAQAQADDASRQALLYQALGHWQRTLAVTAGEKPGERAEEQERGRLMLRAAGQLNRAEVLAGLGFAPAAEEVRKAALDEARQALAPSFEWRALAALGRYGEALAILERMAPVDYDLHQGELMQRLAVHLEQLAARDAEAAFALLERLSEIERVQVLGRGVLGLDDPGTSELLAAAAPHLAESDRLRASLGKAQASEKDYLQLRLQQEQTLIDTSLGQNLERLPSFYSQAGPGALRLAAAATVLADTAARSAGKPPNKSEAAQQGYRDALQRFKELQDKFNRECTAGKGGRLCTLIAPRPVEAVDVQERLAGRTLLRFIELGDGRWLLFTVAGQGGIKAETLDRTTLEARLSVVPPLPAAFEEPWRFPNAKVLSWGLSATHLLAALEQRSPFRRQVLDLAGWWPVSDRFARIPPEQGTSRIADAHTLVFPGRAGLLAEVPTRPAAGGTTLPLWEEKGGERRPLTELGTSATLSLAVAPSAGAGQAYALGHLLALQGVASLLVADNAKAGELAPFVAAYATQSLATAREQLPGSWLLLGDWGLDAKEASALGKRRFLEYARMGVVAHNDKRYAQALALFENALAIAEENADLAKQKSALHRYARESAFAAGRTERAILHAEALLKGIAREKPYSAEHADALLRLGLLQGRAERYVQAAASLKEGVAIFAELGQVKEQAQALADFGLVMENAVDYPTARSLFEEAAGLQRTLKDEVSLAEQFRNLGRLYDMRLSRYALAERYYAQAEEIYARSGNDVLVAETLLERGRCQRLLGNFSAADRLYSQALAKLGPKSGDKELRTRMRIVLEQANNAWFQGRYQEAFDLREQVEKNAKSEGWPLEREMAKNTGGLIWWTLGDHKRSLLELRGALELAEKLEQRRDEVATTLNNIGLVQRESGDYRAALETLEKALAIDRKLASSWAMAYDLRNLGQTRLKMGDPAAALKLLAEAGELAAGIGDKVNLAKIFLARGDAEARLKQSASAAASYRRALETATELQLREVSWRAQFGLARLQQEAGDAATAVASYRQALETIEGLRAEIKLDLLKDGFLADKMDVYAGLTGLLVDLKRDDEAFEVAERSRARNLIDILGRQRLSLAGGADQDLYDRQNRLKEQLQEQEALAAQAATDKERVMYSQALEKLRADYQDLLLDIERKRPELLALVKVKPLGLAELQALLEPGVALLSYYQLPERMLCWRIERDGAKLFVLKAPARDLAEEISSYRRMLQNLEPLEKKSRELYDKLLSQPLAGVGQLRALGIVPHASLHYLAFATLNDGRDYLIDRQPLFHLPASSVLRYSLARRQPQKNLRVLAVGNPALGDPALDLPFAEREAGTLRWNYPDVTILTRERATESWVREHISGFGIIHLASHGEFDPLNPLFSAVRLAADPKADGKLQADEVFGLDIKADLVVLSACQTGLGDIRGGDDVVGMNRAFLFAGTHSLLSSLWRVSDVSTAILMKQFYRDYSRNGKAASLRRAMQHVRQRYPHPGYWGAFVLTGDYL